MNVRQVENSERTASVVCDFEDGKAKNRVQFVNLVIKEEDTGRVSESVTSSWTRRRTNRAGQWGRETLSRRRIAGGRCC